MFIVVGKDHDVRGVAFEQSLVLCAHIIGCVRQFKCLVLVEHVGYDGDMAPLFFSEVII